MPTQSPLSLVTDPAKINPVGAQQADLEEYQKSLDAQIKALEQRYSQPNWFNVAAGFAKPQLGGFLASLGSASQAMGENEERRRESMLPVAQMRTQLAQSKILTGANKTQADEFEAWRASGKPMDAATYTRLVSLNPNSPVSEAAKKFYEGAKSGLEITTAATAAMGKDPMLQLDDFTRFQLRPDVNQKQIDDKQAEVNKNIDAAKPPQMDQAQWNAMSRYERMEQSNAYAKAQREAGMGVEAVMQQQALQAPSRLALLGSIRDLALGVGLKEEKTPDGQTVSGRDQMAGLLNYFGGNNPFEVLARAAADGKLGDKLAEIDTYARQNSMSPQARDHFQKLAKLLAENQVTLRNGSLNPTDQFSALQQAGSPNIGNSQTALVTLVDLIGHGEKNSIDKYRYVVDKKIPYTQLGLDPDYLDKQRDYAAEHRRIATSNPFENTPSWYNPASGNATAKPQAKPQGSAPPGNSKERPNERTINGQVWVRQPDGSYKPKAQ